MQILKNKIFILILLILIGVASLITVYLRMPSQKNFVYGNRMEASRYGIGVFDDIGNTLFSISPLNDYFYQGIAKEHIQNKLTDSNNGSLLQKNITSISDFLFNRKSLIWNTTGENSKGKSSISYTINSVSKKVEITRQIWFENTDFDGVGEVINICPDCLIVDDKKRVYFNGDLVTKVKIDNAVSLGLTPILINGNQMFPKDTSKISILSATGRGVIEIAVSKNAGVFLQDKWHLIEFKYSFPKTRNVSLTQQIIIPN